MRNNINKNRDGSKQIPGGAQEVFVLVRAEYAVSGGPCSTYWKSGF